jgi:hypothetical protein
VRAIKKIKNTQTQRGPPCGLTTPQTPVAASAAVQEEEEEEEDKRKRKIRESSVLSVAVKTFCYAWQQRPVLKKAS